MQHHQRPSEPQALMRAWVVGSTNVDVVLRVSALPAPGETVRGTRTERLAGGKGGNQAVALARLGAAVRFTSAVGQVVGAAAHGRGG